MKTSSGFMLVQGVSESNRGWQRPLLLLVAALGSAGAPTLSRAEVDSRGGFSTMIPIEVPAFHGITPRVALSYHSGGGDFAGAGWDLDTGPIVTRTSATRGTPLFAADDRFWLDGEELVPCAAGSTSPSCSTAVTAFGSSAGFFSTRVDHFQRIRFVAATGGWAIWDRDGTQRELSSGDGGLSYRLRKVQDTHGNRVAYTWVCAAGGVAPCQLDAIRYGATAGGAGAEIRFYREGRPDGRTFATGLGQAFAFERLRSIAVRHHGSLVRAYRLTYGPSLETGASILTSVQQFGRDALVDPSGVVTAGATPPLPAMELGTPSLSSRGSWSLSEDVSLATLLDVSAPPTNLRLPHYAPTGTDIASQAGSTAGGDLQPSGSLLGDFDGDGRNEVLVWGVQNQCATIATNVHLSSGSGVGPLVHDNVRVGAPQNHNLFCKAMAWVADVDGDGRDDLVFLVQNQLSIALAQGDGRFAQGPVRSASATTDACSVGDVDGDGRSDLVCLNKAAGLVQTYRATQAGFVDTSVGTSTATGPNFPFLAGLELSVGDADGDGLSDVILSRPSGGSTLVWIGISLGDGAYVWESQTFPFTGKLATPDLDGDGKLDLAFTTETSNTTTAIHSALARKGFTSGRFVVAPVLTASLVNIGFGDVDGDGRADLIGDLDASQIGQNLAVQLSDPAGGLRPVGLSQADCSLGGADPPMNLAADLDGDGLADPLCIAGDGLGNYTVIDRPSQARGADRHRWMRADVDGDGRPELVYVAFNNPGYTVHVVSTVSQTRTSYDVRPGPGLTGLVEPDAGRWMTMDVGSPAGPPDGKDDLVLLENLGGRLQITALLSTGNGAFVPVQSAPLSPVSPFPPFPLASAASSTLGFMPVNLDGDGLTDLARLLPNDPSGVILQTLRATGGGQFVWSASVAFGAGSSAPMTDRSAHRFRATDVNGDGLTDFVHVEAVAGSNLQIRTLRARAGGGFDEVVSTQPTWGVADSQHWHAADLDGDGFVDLFHLAHNQLPYFSCLSISTLSGDGLGGFVPDFLGGLACVPVSSSTNRTDPLHWRLFDDSTGVVTTDLDGDGRSEILHVTHQTDASGASQLLVTTLRRDPATGAWSVSPAPIASGFDLGDSWSWNPVSSSVTGYSGLGYVHPQRALSLLWQRVRDELVTLDNGLGLTTTVTRGPFLGYRSYLPAGIVPRVVTQVSISDAAYSPPVSDATSYFYSGARWSDALSRFQGYDFTASLDGRLTLIDRFAIGDACGAQLVQHDRRDGTFAFFGFDSVQYEPSGAAPPYRCLEAVRQRYECEKAADCLLAEQVSFQRDAFSNVIQEDRGANQAAPGVVYQPVYPNPTEYLVDRTAYRVEYGWNGSYWSPIRGRLFLYDHATSWVTPPGSLGELTAIADWDDQSGGLQSSSFGYDTEGNLASTLSPGGKQTTVTPNSTYPRFPASVCDGLRHCTSQGWDLVLGQLATVTDANGATTITSRDAHGRVIRVDRPGNAFTRTSYLAAGTLTGPQDGRQRVRTEVADGSPMDGVLWSETFYDGSGRTYRSTREGGAAVTISYRDGSARPAYVSEVHPASVAPSLWNEYLYDGLGRLTQTTHADGTPVTSRYELVQVTPQVVLRRVTTTDELGVPHVRRFDGRGSVIAVDERNGTQVATTGYGYDAAGRLTTITDAQGHLSQLVWDSLDRPVRSTDPDRGTRNVSHYPDGEVFAEVDTAGKSVSYTYDSLGRVATRADADASGTVDRSVSFTYDDVGNTGHGASIGRLVQVDDTQLTTALSTSFVYDLAGRSTLTRTCIDRFCLDLGRKYDVAGRLRALLYPDASGSTSAPGAESVGYEYDDAGGLSSVGKYAKIVRELDGKPRRIDDGNGVSETFDYDPARRWLNRIAVSHPNTGSLLRLDYNHDPSARIYRQLVQGSQTADLGYRYDDLGRLVEVISPDPARREQMVYDTIGRLRWSPRLSDLHYDDPAHLHAATSSDRGAKRKYDDNGNALALYDPNGRDLGVRWTADGHVAEIDDGAKGQYFLFGYDLGGKRAVKAGPNGTSRYFGSLLELDPKGKLVKYYLAGDRLIARNDGDVYYFHADVAHATRIETNAFGKVVNSYEYWASGEPFKTSEQVDHDIGFSGARTDDSLGLVAMGARVYDPLLNQFLSADSVIPDPYRPQSLDRYSYVENDPVNHWDPSGHLRVQVELRKARLQESAFRVLANVEADAEARLNGMCSSMTFFGGDCGREVQQAFHRFDDWADFETRVLYDPDGRIVGVINGSTSIFIRGMIIEETRKAWTDYADWKKQEAAARLEAKTANAVLYAEGDPAPTEEAVPTAAPQTRWERIKADGKDAWEWTKTFVDMAATKVIEFFTVHTIGHGAGGVVGPAIEAVEAAEAGAEGAHAILSRDRDLIQKKQVLKDTCASWGDPCP